MQNNYVKMAAVFFSFITILFAHDRAIADSIGKKAAGSRAIIPASSDVELPQGLKEKLSDIFPGFKLATQKDYIPSHQTLVEWLWTPGEGSENYLINSQWGYGSLKGDFNGDKRDDYALIIKYKGEFYWLVALRTQGESHDFVRNLSEAYFMAALQSARTTYDLIIFESPVKVWNKTFVKSSDGSNKDFKLRFVFYVSPDSDSKTTQIAYVDARKSMYIQWNKTKQKWDQKSWIDLEP